MKLMTALLAFVVVASAFAQSVPPRSGSRGSTITNNNGNTTTPNPIPTPRPTPNPTPRPTPRPTPTPDYRNERYSIRMGDVVLFRDEEYEVVGIDNARAMILVQSIFYAQRPFEVPVNAVALTQGCVASRTGRVCAGDLTVGLNGVYYTVIGIFWNGTVVVQTTDSSRTIYGNIDPNSLKVLRD